MDNILRSIKPNQRDLCVSYFFSAHMFSRLALSALVLTTGLNSVVGDSAAEAEAYNAARAAANPSCSSVDTAAATHGTDCPTSTTWRDRAATALDQDDIQDGMVLLRESGSFNIPRWFKVTAELDGFKIQYCQTSGNECAAQGVPGAGHGWAYNYFPGAGDIADTYWTAQAATNAGSATGIGECVVIDNVYYQSSNGGGDQIMPKAWLASTSSLAWKELQTGSDSNGNQYLTSASEAAKGCPTT